MSLVNNINLLLRLQRVKPLQNVIYNSSLEFRSFINNQRCYSSSIRNKSPQLLVQLPLTRHFSHSRYNYKKDDEVKIKNATTINTKVNQSITSASKPIPANPSSTTTQTTPSPTASKPILAKEYIWNIPNILTISRIIAAPVIGYLVVEGQTFYALSLFVYSGVTDLLDGYIARRFKMQTVVGSVIDPLADKVLMMTLATCLGVSGDIPLYMAVVILGRDILLGLSAFYYRYISLPPPITFKRYWDFSIPSAEVHPTTISKYNTFFQMVYLGSSLIYPVIESSLEVSTSEALSLGLTGFGYLVATTTIWSGLSYVFSNSAVKILRPRK